MPYEGAKELFSNQTPQYVGLVGLQEAGSAYNWATTVGQRARMLGDLNRVNPNTYSKIKVLVDDLERLGHDPHLFVGKSGNVSLRLAGQIVDVPVWDQVRGTVQMGASKYGAALHGRFTGSGLEKLNVMDAWLQQARAMMPGTGVSWSGIDPIQDQSQLPRALRELSRTMRESWMQSVATKSGQTNAVKSWFLKNRLRLDLKSHPELHRKAKALMEAQKAFAMQRTWRGFQFGQGLEDEILRMSNEFREQLLKAAPGTNLAGLKPGAFMPQISRTADRVYLNLLPADAVASAYNVGTKNLQKGRYQVLQLHTMHRDELLDGVQVGVRQHALQNPDRIVPIVTERSYFNKVRQGMAHRQARLGRPYRPTELLDYATTSPLTVAVLDPGQSTEAHRFLRKYVDDTGALIGTKRARNLAGFGERFRKVQVNQQSFKGSAGLAARIKGMTHGEVRQIAETGVDYRLMREGDQLIEADRKYWARSHRDKYLLGLSEGPAGTTMHPLHHGEVIESVERRGDDFIFNIKGRSGTGLGAGLTIGETRRFGVTGMYAGLGDLGVDIAVGSGQFGLDFAKDAAMRQRMYLGHVFSRLEKLKLGYGKKTALMERVAHEMGLAYEWVGQGTPFSGKQFQAVLTSAKDKGEARDKLIRLGMGIGDEKQIQNRLATHKIVSRILADVKLKPTERQQFLDAFRVQRRGMGEIMRAQGLDVAPETARRLERQGAWAWMFEGTPVGARMLDMPDKNTIGWRMSEHGLFMARGAGLRQQSKKLGAAFRVLEKALRPSVARSGVASDAFRLIGQFSTDISEFEPKLMKADRFTVEDLKRFDLLPRAEKGRIAAEQFKGDTIISTMEAGAPQFRRGGFYFKLRPEDQIDIGLTDRFGKTGYAKRTGEIFLPGMEMFGKAGQRDEIWTQGVSKLDESGKVQRKLFGDYMNVLRTMEDYASGTATATALQERLNILYHGMSEEMLGKNSLVQRYFRATSATGGKVPGLMGRTITNPALAGTADEALSIGVHASAIPKHLRKQARMGTLMATLGHYPASDPIHQALVKVKVLEKDQIVGMAGDLLEGTNPTDLGKVVVSSPAVRLMAQRDLDFDWSYVRFIEGTGATRAAQRLHAEDLKRMHPAFRLLMKHSAPDLREASDGLGARDWTEWSKEHRTSQQALTEELSSIVRQQGKTPVASNSFVRQRHLTSWLGNEQTQKIVLDAIEGDDVAERSARRLMEMMGDPSQRRYLGEMWTATIYSVLKKDAAERGIADMMTEIRQNARHAVGRETARKELAQYFMGMFEGNPATQHVLEEMGLADAQTVNVSPGEMAARRSAAQKKYFEPLAEFMAHAHMLEDKAMANAHLKHALVALQGEAYHSNRLPQLEGVIGRIAQMTGTDQMPRMNTEFMEHLDQAEALHNVLMDTDGMRVRDAIEIMSEQGGKPGISNTGKSLVAEGMAIAKRVWQHPAGKIGTLAGGAIVAGELFTGLFSDDTPPPVMMGGGAPLPPRPPMAGLAARAHQHHQVQMTSPSPRIERPHHMATRIRAAAVQARPGYLTETRGYVQGLPQRQQMGYPDTEGPGVNRWSMSNYLSRRLNSSF